MNLVRPRSEDLGKQRQRVRNPGTEIGSSPHGRHRRQETVDIGGNGPPVARDRIGDGALPGRVADRTEDRSRAMPDEGMDPTTAKIVAIANTAVATGRAF